MWTARSSTPPRDAGFGSLQPTPRQLDQEQDMGRRALVVVLEDDLHPSRVVGLYHNISQLPGVQCVADLSSISRDVLDLWLVPPEPPATSGSGSNGRRRDKR
jgi:hypothetical protein